MGWERVGGDEASLWEQKGDRIRFAPRRSSAMGGLIVGDPACEECDGRGVVLTDRGAALCKCAPEARLRVLLMHARLPDETASATVNGFDAETDGQKEAVSVVKEWVKSFGAGSPSLYLFGDVGRGKSHLACAALKGVVKLRGVSGLYWHVPHLLGAMRADVDRVERLMEECLDVDVLVLDDLGSGHTDTAFAIDVLERLVDGRIGRPTVYTSNVHPHAMGRLSPRIASRLGRCVELVLDGEDYRAQQGQRAAARIVAIGN